MSIDDFADGHACRSVLESIEVQDFKGIRISLLIATRKKDLTSLHWRHMEELCE